MQKVLADPVRRPTAYKCRSGVSSSLRTLAAGQFNREAASE